MFDMMEQESELEIFQRLESLHEEYERKLEKLWESIQKLQETTEGEV